ncbi:MAG: response regulator transcription factor [Burkholderiales bacterium]|nr:response regulator transcription factor [Burkholderiales bacterium]
MQRWRVLVVEDDAATREFFAEAVRRDPGLVLAGCVGTVGEAFAWLGAPHEALDVLLVDIGLPDGSGLQVIRETLRHDPACEALVISMFGDEENVLASIEAGAMGYIHKDSSPDDIAGVIHEMKRGGSPISPMIARRVLGRFRGGREAARPQAMPSPDAPALSPREQEVLELVARGFSYADIARLKAVSIHTVQTHIKHLYAKLAVSSRTEAVFEATQLGLLQPPGRV